jgi:hypothetical protein
MKLIATTALRFGLNTYEEGDEFEVPDKFGEVLVASGNASEAKDKPAKKPAAKKAEPEAEEAKPKTYKTRQIKAENGE